MSNRFVVRKITLPFLVSCFFLLFAGSLGRVWAQEVETTGTIQGTVRDTDGNPVANARVAMRSREVQTGSVVRSGKDGAYVSEALLPGNYTIRVDGTDFRGAQSIVTVQANAATTADFKLEAINPEPVRLESKVSGEVVGELPLNGRNFLDTARLEPGVQVVDGAALDAGKSGFRVLSTDGQRGRLTHYDIDEVEAMDETRGAVTLNLPADAVSEMSIVRAVPEVFQSLNASGAVRVTTRSGGDEWHGDLFGNYRDRRMGMAGFPSSDPKYSRQHYGFGAGGALIKDKAFLFLSGERSKQDGSLPVYQGFPFNFLSTRAASDRENMFTGRLDYNWSENAKWFDRFSYDNANQIGPTDSLSALRDQINVPSNVFGLDWNRGRFAHSGRFGYQKMVNAINPALAQSLALPGQATFHQQIGSFEYGPSVQGPRQTIQRDIFGRYDGSTTHDGKYDIHHTLRFGGALHRIAQGDFYAPGDFGPSVTSSNGLDVINAINGNPNPPFPELIPNDPKGAADDPLNYPVSTVTIFNGLGNFSENSAFGRPNGGHFDTRLEGYLGDTLKVLPNLNVTLGVNYVRDSGRTNSDLGAIPCSAIDTNLVPKAPCSGSQLILDQFGYQGLGAAVRQPNWNFAPQAGLAWDPSHNGRTVIRVGGGMFFDNFLLQNAYQDRMNRLANGQYSRSLTLCPTGTVLFPDGTPVSTSPGGLDIATQICGQPIGSVAPEIEALQSQLQANQAAVTGGQNVYSLASLANFGGMLAPNFSTPRTVHMNAGFEHQFGDRTFFSIDYTRQIGTKLPLGIDTNHVGDSAHLDSNAGVDAINATLSANPAASACTLATSPGSSSQTAVACYMSHVPSASIVDFARQGLDSANAYCGPFPCAVLGLRNAAFGGLSSHFDPGVARPGSNLMYFPTGRSQYDSVQLRFKTVTGDNPFRGVRRLNLAMSYTFSKYRSNVAEADGSGGDYSVLSVAEDYLRPHLGHFGLSGLDRRHQVAFAPTADLPHGLRLAMIAQLASPLPLTVRIPQLAGGGVAGEIFRSDVTGDGTVGDLLPTAQFGGAGARTASDLTNAIALFNRNFSGHLTPAGQALVIPNVVNGLSIPALMTPSEAQLLGAVIPVLQLLPGHPAQATWLKTIDLRLSRPIHVSDRVTVEPTAAAFNVFNFANFGAPGRQLSGILNGAPGSSLNNSSSPAFCGGSGLCTARLDRIVAGSGTYGNGAPRQLEFGVKVVF